MDGNSSPRGGRRAGVACWLLAGFFLLWAIIRIGGLERGFPLVQLIAYTPYGLLLSLVALLVVVLCRRWLAAGFLLIAAVAFALVVLPREMGGQETLPGGTPVRVLSLNLKRGDADAEEVAKLARARDADIVVLQELSQDEVSRLDRAGFAVEYPQRTLTPKPGNNGGGIYSRWSLSDLGNLSTDHHQPIAAVEVPGSIPIEVISVHPQSPSGPKQTSRWAENFERFPAAGTADLPIVLAGDFNATLDHAALRDLIDTGYRDAADVTGNGLVSTWPSSLEPRLPITLDHVLAEKGIYISRYDVEKVDGTDHRAIFVELLLPPVRGEG